MMSLKEIFSDAVRYPFSDVAKFVILGILALISGISSILTNYTVEGSIMAISGVVSFVASLIVSGYGISVIKSGIEKSDDMPSISFLDNLIDGIKFIIINIVYFIIPIVIVIVLAVLSSMGYVVSEVVVAGLAGIVIVVGIVLFILFGIMGEVAVARFANTGEFSDAFALKSVFGDVRRIGILKIFGFIIIQFVIILVILAILIALGFIPYVGLVISSFIGGAYLAFFYNRSLGLLYADSD